MPITINKIIVTTIIRKIDLIQVDKVYKIIKVREVVNKDGLYQVTIPQGLITGHRQTDQQREEKNLKRYLRKKLRIRSKPLWLAFQVVERINVRSFSGISEIVSERNKNNLIKTN